MLFKFVRLIFLNRRENPRNLSLKQRLIATHINSATPNYPR